MSLISCVISCAALALRCASARCRHQDRRRCIRPSASKSAPSADVLNVSARSNPRSRRRPCRCTVAVGVVGVRPVQRAMVVGDGVTGSSPAPSAYKSAPSAAVLNVPLEQSSQVSVSESLHVRVGVVGVRRRQARRRCRRRSPGSQRAVGVEVVRRPPRCSNVRSCSPHNESVSAVTAHVRVAVVRVGRRRARRRCRHRYRRRRTVPSPSKSVAVGRRVDTYRSCSRRNVSASESLHTFDSRSSESPPSRTPSLSSSKSPASHRPSPSRSAPSAACVMGATARAVVAHCRCPLSLQTVQR